MPEWQGTDAGTGADAEGKVTKREDALLAETLQTARTIQNRFSKLDAILEESQRACPSGDPDPGTAVDHNQLSRIRRSENLSTPRNQLPEQLKCLRYTSSFALWSQVRHAFVSYRSACRFLLMERMDRAP